MIFADMILPPPPIGPIQQYGGALDGGSGQFNEQQAMAMCMAMLTVAIGLFVYGLCSWVVGFIKRHKNNQWDILRHL